MNVLLISQCTKNAREESCRILDQFAERKGNGAWQTLITQEGLNKLQQLLRKTARRNTAVACHWLKKSGATELLWIVGNISRFNERGTIPTNRTSKDILRKREHHWHCAESVSLLAAIAGLFHDFGKAGGLFQDTLSGDSAKHYQPWRHEWISLRLFQAFVGQQNDRQWLEKLANLQADDEAEWLDKLKPDQSERTDSPFITLPPLAQTIAWLIISHHRLPQAPKGVTPDREFSDGWLLRQLNATWNALNHQTTDWTPQELARAWQFPYGTPLRSRTWRSKAQQLAKRANNALSLTEYGSLGQLFSLHIARLVLMFADHYYSAQPPSAGWQDENYSAWANSDRETGKRKQKLDEHLAGVSHHALLLGRALPWLRRSLPAIARHKGLRKRTGDEKYAWQNKAWDTAVSLRERSREQGFFGVNMASTGCGKTLANARIMYALARESEGCRFTVALGLRTLTLQTGEALRSRLRLGEDDLAVLIGSQAVKTLYETPDASNRSGSESEETLFEHNQYVHYEGVSSNAPLRQWLAGEDKLSKLINAPVLVATIDHLMPATEGLRGGKQIPPMLRLLTSDLVLDEPDDFDISDQHALCRLVNWAGMLGARVLLSSATLPPAQVQALFAAYCAGRQQYQCACGTPGSALKVCCAWFDEDRACPQELSDPKAFSAAHHDFVSRRAERIAKKPALRRASLIDIAPSAAPVREVAAQVAQCVHENMLQLHHHHHQKNDLKQTISLGLVRFANINPLVAVARALMACPSPENTRIHYCVYHSQHPLAVRSSIEKYLDRAFTRHDIEQLWQLPDIAKALTENTEQHHLFVVLATSVVEVGRDWDADWGITEPSSIRSLIQLAGRLQRHRQNPPDTPNLLILNNNIRSLMQLRPAYCYPGFENQRFRLASHRFADIVDESAYQTVNARPGIISPQPRSINEETFSSLIELEHQRLWNDLLGKNLHRPAAADWWRSSMTWCGELQKLTPFRNSHPDSAYFLCMEDEYDEPEFRVLDSGHTGSKDPGIFYPTPLTLGKGVSPWLAVNYRKTLLLLAEEKDLELSEVSSKYGEIRLPSRVEQEGGKWLYHPCLGVFREIE